MKTAISLDHELFQRAQQAAGELGVNRSRLYAMALNDFLRRRENRRLLERINLAYAGPPDEDERGALEGALEEATRLEDGEW